MAISRDQAAAVAGAYLERMASERAVGVADAQRLGAAPTIGQVRSFEEIARPPLVYGLQDKLKDCWIAYVAHPSIAIRPSEIVVVSRSSGEVLYHGSAYDEG